MKKNRNYTIILFSIFLLVGLIMGGYVGKTRGIPFTKKIGEYSIGIYTGKSPFDLKPCREVVNPVLKASDVTDVIADFVADPFMVNENKKWYMFFEVLNQSSQHGDIGLALSEDGFNWRYEKIVLDEAFHLSYPYVFKWQGQYYMIPETRLAYAIRLYKADEFPYKWSYVKDLVAGNYLDPSIFRNNGKWWMFASERNDVLHLFYADQLDGVWTRHPQSPLIIRDGNVSRPGGRVLISGGRIFRFTQDCDPGYGNQVRAFEITELSMNSYKEKPIAQNPILKASGCGWNAEQMHHIDAHQIDLDNWMACVDGYGKNLIFGLKY